MEYRSYHTWTDLFPQKVRSADYASFSILGLALTYSIGLLIVALSFIAVPILGLLQKYGRYSQYAYLEWELHTSIQLHRMAQDQLGHGHWSRCDETIPITQPDDLLAPFDLSDPMHPVLVRDKPEDPSPDSSLGLTSDESSSKQSDTDSSRNTRIGVRRAFTDARVHAAGRKHSHGLDELDHHQKRPSTAP